MFPFVGSIVMPKPPPRVPPPKSGDLGPLAAGAPLGWSTVMNFEELGVFAMVLLVTQAVPLSSNTSWAGPPIMFFRLPELLTTTVSVKASGDWKSPLEYVAE